MVSFAHSLSRILALACLCILCLIAPCHSQYDPFSDDKIQNRITTEDGISSDIATCFLKDSQGFMWIGTDKGLNRYDGYDFITFTHNQSDSSSISDDHIVSLCEDLEGNIWIGTFYRGLNKYDPETETITRYPEGRDDPYDLGRSAIWALCATSLGEIWFSAVGDHLQSIYSVDPITGNIRFISHDTLDHNVPADIHCHAIYEDSKGEIWAGGATGLLKYDTRNRDFTEVNDYHPGVKKTDNEVGPITEDGYGNLWINVFRNGIYKFSLENEQFMRHYDIPGDRYNSAMSMHINDKGYLILRTEDITLFDPVIEQFTAWDFDPQLGGIVGNLSSRGLYLDDTGLLWYGIPPGSNRPAGVYRARMTDDGFHLFSFEELQYVESGNEWILAICEDHEGNIWLGGFNTGLIKIKNPFTAPLVSRYRAVPGDPHSLSSDNVSAIFQDHNGTLWVGCWEEGILHRMEKFGATERFLRYTPDDPVVSGNMGSPNDAFRYNDQSWDFTGAGCMRIYEDSNNRLWIGRGTGLELFDRSNGSFYTNVASSPAEAELHEHPVITALVEGESGCLWVGTMFQGLQKLLPPFSLNPPDDPGGMNTFECDHQQITAGGLKDAMITSLCVPASDSEIALWIGTWGGGLVGLINSPGVTGEDSIQLIRYTTVNGLSDNVVLGIHEDDLGNLWLTTQTGLSKLDPKTRKFNSYDVSDGMEIKRFQWLSNHKGKTGHIFFGGEEGLLAFLPDQVAGNPFPPPVVITGFRLFNQQVPIGGDSPLMKSITHTGKIELSYKENFVSFQFAALNYMNTGKNQYRYMMEGLDREWMDAGTNRTASYPNLDPGKYTFRVRGSNNNGIWNDRGASVSIIIRPPPWSAWWSYIIYGMVLIAIVMWYRSYLMKRAKLTAALEVEKMEKQKLKELDHLKSQFFANISHEFRTPLTLLLGPIEDKLKTGQELDLKETRFFRVMQRNAKRLQRLINQLLDLSKLESGKVRLKVAEGNISGFTNSIVQSFLSLAESRNIAYRIEIPKRSIPAYFDPDILEKILSNLISNALKFTPEKGSVTMTMHIRKDEANEAGMRAEFKIKDTGRGIPAGEAEKIFERFYQVNSSDSREYEGTGIGLALCRELAEIHHGDISVKSSSGKGSTFTLVLPCSRARFADDEIAAGKAVNSNPEEFTREEVHMENSEADRKGVAHSLNEEPVLLIVEDNADLRDYMVQNLEDRYRILEAVNGSDGLAKTVEVIPDLVLSDQMMPEMDGTEMCKMIRSDERTCHIPVIMVTAKADRESKIKGLETGANDYLVKPFDADELQIKVRNMIEQQKMVREKLYREFVFGDGHAEVQSTDERFLQKIIDHIRTHMSDPEFNVRNLSRNTGISEVQLYRKLKGSANLTPGELIRNTRLKSSLVLLRNSHDNISQVAYKVGFSDHSYFTKCFRELYGITPKAYAEGGKDIL